jgi:hypothetical protein
LAKRKKAPEGIAVHSEEEATRIAKGHARWDRIPSAFREIPEGEDPHERLDMLNEQEKRDCVDFREGRAVPCEFTHQMRQEEEAERHMQA